MKLSLRSYIILGLVFVASSVTAWLLPVGEFIKGIIATPGVAAMLGVIYQLIRDSAQFERSMFLQQDQQIFNLGATSHMANAAFDKHVQFCEKYMAEVDEAFGTLLREGASQNAKKHSQNLSKIRKEYAAWIPKKMALVLEPFEKTVGKIGILSDLADRLSGSDHPARLKAIDEAYDLFKKVMELDDIESDDPEKKNQLAQENIKEGIRSILGINELTEIRGYIIRKSIEFIGKNA